MKHWLRLAAAAALCASPSLRPVPAGAQAPEPAPWEQESDPRLPNGKSQKDAILKEEYKQNIRDAAALAELAEKLRQEIEKNESYVLSVDSLKKIDDIEKLAKKIRARLRHN